MDCYIAFNLAKSKKCPVQGLASDILSHDWLIDFFILFLFLCYHVHRMASVVCDFLWKTVGSENRFNESKNDNCLNSWGNFGMPCEATMSSSFHSKAKLTLCHQTQYMGLPTAATVALGSGPAGQIKDEGHQSGQSGMPAQLWGQSFPLGFRSLFIVTGRHVSWAGLRSNGFDFTGTW